MQMCIVIVGHFFNKTETLHTNEKSKLILVIDKIWHLRTKMWSYKNVTHSPLNFFRKLKYFSKVRKANKKCILKKKPSKALKNRKSIKQCLSSLKVHVLA